MSTSCYLRLMAMAVVQMIWSIVVTSYTLWFTLSIIPLRPWKNWNFVHSDFGRIDQYLNIFTPPMILTTYYILWWAVPASSLIFFAFFAFGREALDHYKCCLALLKKATVSLTTGLKSGSGVLSRIMTRYARQPFATRLTIFDVNTDLREIAPRNPSRSFRRQLVQCILPLLSPVTDLRPRQNPETNMMMTNMTLSHRYLRYPLLLPPTRMLLMNLRSLHQRKLHASFRIPLLIHQRP